METEYKLVYWLADSVTGSGRHTEFVMAKSLGQAVFILEQELLEKHRIALRFEILSAEKVE